MKERGFTLIEILVVVAIIALLASSVMFALSSVNARARDASRVGDVDQLAKALELYKNQTGNPYPVATTAICLDGDDIVNQALQDQGLISTPIKDPIYDSGPNCMSYATDNDGNEFSIGFYLETDSTSKPQGLNTRS